MTLPVMTKDEGFIKKVRKNLSRFKKDIMLNAKLKLKQWEVKKMAKKTEELPTLDEREPVASEEPTDTEEPGQEEGKVQMITPEQYLHLKLDNLSLQIQEFDSKVQELVEILRKK